MAAGPDARRAGLARVGGDRERDHRARGAARPRPHRPLRAARAAAPAPASRPRSSSGTPASCTPATASACRASTSSSTTPPTSGAARTAGSSSSRTARRRRPGSGYAMENRLVCQRVLPDALPRRRRAPARAVLPLRCGSALQAVAPADVEDPRIVVLSPGPYNETAFEHAVLASTLGYPLVEGSDLTVRGGSVWMRSLGQLEPVHVILRRVDDTYCDPLELNPESQLGVTGLVAGDACRAPCRWSTRSAPACSRTRRSRPSEEAVARHLLGRPLRLPAVPTLVVRRPGGARVRPRAPRPSSCCGPRRRSAATGPCSAGRRPPPSWRSSAPASRPGPADWVGQAAADDRERADARPATASSCAAACCARSRSRADRRYVVMPGGLTRVAPAAAAGASRRPGRRASSKDTWVLASEPERPTGFWLQSGPADAGPRSRRAHPVARRREPLVARALRGARRGGHAAPAGRPATGATSSRRRRARPASPRCASCWRRTTRVTATQPGFTGDDGPMRLAAPATSCARSSSTTRAPARSPTRRAALVAAAEAVRDQLSRDTWLVVGEPRPRARLGGPSASRRPLARGDHAEPAGAQRPRSRRAWSATSAGATWTPGGAWSAACRCSRSCARRSADGARHRDRQPAAGVRPRPRPRASSPTGAATASQAQLETLLDLLLVDEDNPRSVGHGLARLADDLDALPPGADGRLREDQRHLLRVSTALRLCETASLAETDDRRPPPRARGAARPSSADGLLQTARAPSSASTSSTGCRSARCRRRDDLPRHPPDGVRVRGGRGREPQPPAPPAARRPRARRASSTEIASLPLAGDYSEHTDFFGNRVGYLAIHEPHRTLDITATSVVEVDDGAARAVAVRRAPVGGGPRRGLARRPPGRGRRDALRAGLAARRGVRRAARLRRALVPARPGAARRASSTSRRASTRTSPTSPARPTVGTTLEEVLVERRGSARTSRTSAIGCLRSLGLPGPLRERLPGDRPPPGRPKLSAPTSRTPGSRCSSPAAAGSTSTRRTTSSSTAATSSPRSGATTATCRPISGVIYTEGSSSTLTVKVDVSVV